MKVESKSTKTRENRKNPTRYFREKNSGYGFFLQLVSRFQGYAKKKDIFFCVRKREGRKARCGYPLKDNIFGWKIWF